MNRFFATFKVACFLAVATTWIHISGFPNAVTDSDLRKSFGCFGAIAALSIKRTGVDNNSMSKPYAFLMFTRHEEAKKAVAASGNVPIFGTRPVVSLLVCCCFPGFSVIFFLSFRICRARGMAGSVDSRACVRLAREVTAPL